MKLARNKRIVAIKAALSATGAMFLGWALLTPVGIILLERISELVLRPLDSIGVVDVGDFSNGLFVPNYIGVVLLAAPMWIVFFGYFFVYLKKREDRSKIS